MTTSTPADASRAASAFPAGPVPPKMPTRTARRLGEPLPPGRGGEVADDGLAEGGRRPLVELGTGDGADEEGGERRGVPQRAAHEAAADEAHHLVAHAPA